VRKKLCSFIAGFSLLASSALAAPHEARVPLHDGRLRLADLSAQLLEEAHLPTTHLPPGEISLRGIGGSLFVEAMNRSLGDGCRMNVSADALVLHVDPDKLPASMDTAERALRIFTATAAPEATAAQARHYGLLMPSAVDPNKPMVVLVHGLDMDGMEWGPLGQLLKRSGYQVAYFGYPDDQPLDDDGQLLAKHLQAVRETFPAMRLNVITYSMGSLVARSYIEGPDYRGGVDHLILLAPPNHGSSWARLRILAEWKEHLLLCLNDRDWRPTWMITDGLGEAGRDLNPHSNFLRELNARPRRDDVRYTIIEGDEHPMRRLTADFVQGSEMLIPGRAMNWWGLRQTRVGLSLLATKIRSHADQSDGPVTLTSAALPGVADVVQVHADHETIYRGDGDQLPAAWQIIKDRLETKP